MKKRLFSLLGIVLSFGFVFSGCDQPQDSVPTEKTTIDVVDSAVVLDCMDSYALSAEVENADGIVWSSSDPAVLTVDENGVIRSLLKEGKATVTAAANGVSDSCEVAIVAKHGAPTVAVESEIVLSEGASYASPLSVIYNGKDVSSQATFAVSAVDETQTVATATITDGKIVYTGTGLGETAFVVSTKLLGKTYAETVSLSVKNTDVIYTVGGASAAGLLVRKDNEAYTSDVEVYYKGVRVSDDQLTWSIENERIATIGANGRLQMGKEGTTLLKTEYLGTAIAVMVTVQKEHAATVALADQEIDLDLNISIDPTTKKKVYAVNATKEASISIADSSVELGEVLSLSLDGVALDPALASIVDGKMVVKTAAFGAQAYGEKTLAIETEGADTIRRFTAKVLLVTKAFKTSAEVETAMAMRYKGEIIYGYYTLAQDIECNSKEMWSDNNGLMDWNAASGFRGTLDGKGHAFKNYATAIGGLSLQMGRGAVIKNVTFEVGMHNNEYSCIIAREISETTLENVVISFNANIYARAFQTGLIAGAVKVSTLTNVTINAAGWTLANVFGNTSSAKNSTFKNVVINAAAVTNYCGGATEPLPGTYFNLQNA